MEIIEKQVEKVKEVPTDGYYGYGRRDVNGKAIYGEVCLPNTPTVTGYVGANQCGCPRVVSGTTATV